MQAFSFSGKCLTGNKCIINSMDLRCPISNFWHHVACFILVSVTISPIYIHCHFCLHSCDSEECMVVVLVQCRVVEYSFVSGGRLISAG